MSSPTTQDISVSNPAQPKPMEPETPPINTPPMTRREGFRKFLKMSSFFSRTWGDLPNFHGWDRQALYKHGAQPICNITRISLIGLSFKPEINLPVLRVSFRPRTVAIWLTVAFLLLSTEEVTVFLIV